MSYGYLCQIKIKLIIIIIILQILSLSKGGFYHLRGIARTTCDWWNQRKKISEDKFDYHEKTVEMKKLLVMPLKSLSLLAAMTKEWHCFFDAFFHTHTKDWRAKISCIDPCPRSNSQKSREMGKMLYNTCEKGFIFTNFTTYSKQIYENINSFTKA